MNNKSFNIMTTMKNITIAAVLGLSCLAHADVMPTNKWGDIPPQMLLTNVAQKVGISLTNDVKLTDAIAGYTGSASPTSMDMGGWKITDIRPHIYQNGSTWVCDITEGDGSYSFGIVKELTGQSGQLYWTPQELETLPMGTFPSGVTVTYQAKGGGYQLGSDSEHILAPYSSLQEIAASIPSVALTNETLYVNGWKTNVVTRRLNGAVVIGPHKASTSWPPSPGENCLANGYLIDASGSHSHAEGNHTTSSGQYSHAEGSYTTSSGNHSHAEGNHTTSSGEHSHAEGYFTTSSGQYSHAAGFFAVVTHNNSWCWQGVNRGTYYYSHGHGTFNINPAGGTDGFWIGETNFTQHIKNIATGRTKKKIAMFILDVNLFLRHTLTNNANVIYTGFELKASTNNFDKYTSDNVRLQYWSQSHAADTGVSGSDKMKIYMPVGNDDSYDMRSYKRFPNTLSLPKSQLGRLVVLVDTSCLVRHPENNGDWLSEDNEDLVWVYMRDTENDGTETYPGTETPWWHPITPVRWFSRMPNWAQ